MKPPTVFRFISRPTALATSCYPRKTGSRTLKLSRDFSATPQRPFIDECLIGTHTVITAVHDTTGLSWAVTIPLLAFLVRIVIVTPIDLYGDRACRKGWEVGRQLEGSRLAIEKEVQEVHKDKSPVELRRLQNIALRSVSRQLTKQNGAQSWRGWMRFVKVPICLTVMETMRRMTGTEDGMLSLAARSLTTFKGRQYPEPSTADDLIPLEPSFATEGILWFDNLMVPDPLLILPFAMSGVMFGMSGRYRAKFLLSPGSSPERVMKVSHLNYRWNKCLKLAALTVGPATLLFPSAMLLYCISTNLATVVVRNVVHFITLHVRFIQASRAASMSKPVEHKKLEPKPKPKSPPRMQEYRGPLRVPKKKK